MSLTTVDSGLISSGAITLTTQVTGTLPVANGGSGVTTSTGTGANVLGTSPSISGAVLSTMASSVITSGTAVASTSGTSIDFTSIPSWVKRITVMFNGVSTNGTSAVQVQIGAGSVTTSGYVCGITYIASNSTVGLSAVSTGFFISNNIFPAAADSMSGNLIINLLSSNTWIASGVIWKAGASYTATHQIAGNIALGGTLDRVRITTVNGTDAFDAGSINILYE